MRRLFAALPVAIAVLFMSNGAAQEAPAETRVDSRIDSIAMFKNGLAIVRRSIELPASGAARIEGLPSPVHGTFWIGSAVPISAIVTSREIEGPLRFTGANFQEPAAGRQGVVRQPVLILAAEKPDQGRPAKPASVTITYLAKGIAWAPAYRINLDDAKTLTLQQQAVIRNEMEGFRDAELQLISGFPSIQFAHVTSPLSIETSWASFFTQLSQQLSVLGGLHSTAAQIVSNRADIDQSVDLSALPSGEGVDLHYQSIGRRSLREGDSLMLTTGQAQAPYERIVEWTVPDHRDAHGNPASRVPRPGDRDRDPDQDAPWDAIRFKNPLPFPMTTGPAMITANDRFNGQRQSFWVNTGEQTTLSITRALSVRTRSTEQEDELKTREIVGVGSRQYRKVTVKGQLSVDNHRKEAITLVIRRQFSGDLIQADEKPAVTLAEEGVYSVNKRQQLSWTLAIGAGESRTVNYQYSVLILN